MSTPLAYSTQKRRFSKTKQLELASIDDHAVGLFKEPMLGPYDELSVGKSRLCAPQQTLFHAPHQISGKNFTPVKSMLAAAGAYSWLP